MASWTGPSRKSAHGRFAHGKEARPSGSGAGRGSAFANWNRCGGDDNAQRNRLLVEARWSFGCRGRGPGAGHGPPWHARGPWFRLSTVPTEAMRSIGVTWRDVAWASEAFRGLYLQPSWEQGRERDGLVNLP